ncbi:MAG TPA: hypothetical protein VMV81_14175, partial [Phycisphaerae bacterium]|nr:hypothetical protein [Phycisphaerae bacterium]
MSRNREILILLAGPEEIRLARVRRESDRLHVLDVADFQSGVRNADGSALRDQPTVDAVCECIRKKNWAGRELICVVGGNPVACHHYNLPPLKGSALRQAAILKLGQQLHFDIAQAIVAVNPATIGGPRDGLIRVEVSALHEDAAVAALNLAEACSLNISVLTVVPAALGALAGQQRRNAPGLHSILFFDEKSTTLVVLDGPTPFVTTELPMCAADLTQALMRPIISGDDILHLDESAALALRNEIGVPAFDQEIVSLQVTGERLLPLLEPVLQKMSRQITQWLTYASTCTGGVPIRSLVVVGSG